MTMQQPPTTEEGGQNPLTRKLGPLPTWGWALAIGGGFILLRIVRGKSAFPSAGGSSAQVGAVANPIIPGSENSMFGNLSASDIATLKNVLGLQGVGTGGITGIPPGGPVPYPGGVQPPITARPPVKVLDFAGSKTAFGTIYPPDVHTLADAIAWYFRAIRNGAKPKTAFSSVPVH